MINRLSALKTILWALVGVLGAVTVVRFTQGLGAVTNLSDATPWGLWIAFDVMAGVALAAGGFALAAVVYIFHLERYRPFARPAILTALLGYIAVAVGLLYDLGLPWHIWHPIVYWQYHSVLFEVAACVMLYLTVLSLEFAPAVLEHPLFSHPLFQKIYKLLKRATIPLVIAGIVLSTLHQSSLGSLFLITPYRLHPLWYSPIIYVLFFVSAVGLGLMTVVMESLLSGYFLRHKIPTQLLSGLGLAAAGVLGLYALLRLGDLAVRGVLGFCVDGSWQGFLFLFELVASALLPAGLLLFKRVRSSVAGLAACSGLTIFGFVLYRLDVCIIAFKRPEDMGYFPTWMELAVSLGIIAGGALIFLFFAEHLKVYAEEEAAPAAPSRRPSYDPATRDGLLPDELASPRRYSLVAITAAALAVLFLPVEGAQPLRTPVQGPRTVEGLSAAVQGGKGRKLLLPDALLSPVRTTQHGAGAYRPGTPGRHGPARKSFVAQSTRDSIDELPGASVDASARAGNAKPARLLVIDGNRNGNAVLFDHAAHVERADGENSCAECHHLNLPLDRSSSCSACHRDMYEHTEVFSHEAHVAALGGNSGCRECHGDSAAAKTRQTATACGECHEHRTVSDPVIPAPGERWQPAASYVGAMHGLCVKCHERSVERSPDRYPATLARCDHCHDVDRAGQLARMAPRRRTHGKTTENQQ
jgi:Ni/Fe-hydrogenase subunit HybB-like protein